MIEPIKEAGIYRLDAIERPERHPAAVDRPGIEAVACRSVSFLRPVETY